MGVVERAGDRGDDRTDVAVGHAATGAVPHQPGGVGALDVVHRDPQVTVELAAVVHRDDVRMPQRGGQIGFAIESFAEFLVGCRPFAQDLQRVTARQAGMLGEVNVGHPAGPQWPQDGVAGERRRRGDRAACRIALAGSADLHRFPVGTRPDQRDASQQAGDRPDREATRSRARADCGSVAAQRAPAALIGRPSAA